MKKITKVILFVLVGVLSLSNFIQLYYLRNTSKNHILLEQRISDATAKIDEAKDRVNDIEGRIISTITAQITIDGTASLLYLPIN